MVVKRGVNDAPDRRRWRATSAAPATSCASSSSWTSARPTAGAWTTSCPRARDRRAASAPSCRSSRSTPNYRGEVAERWRYRDGARRDRRHLLGHAGVLPRLHARAAVHRGHALHLPVRDRRATTCARCCAAAPTTTRSRAAIAARLARARRPLLRDPHRRDGAACARSRCPTSAAEPPPARMTARAHPRRAARSPSTSTRSTSAARCCATPIAGEHPLTLYVDKREIVTLMTLGQAPEALAIGYLRNQRLVALDRRDRRGAGRLGNRRGRRRRRATACADLDAQAWRSAPSPPAAARARCSAT